MANVSVSHIGLCVSDLDASLRFYTEGLGFEVAEGYDIGDEVAHTLEVDRGVVLRSQMIQHDGFKIELLGWTSPQPSGTPSTSRGQMGITHLSFDVVDLPAVERRLVELGGTVVESTRTELPFPGGAMHLLFLADPDGTRVELMEAVTDPEG
jgi:catechol 2,3-dioxygenase-like lactoylglutathione lyase family enzyme